MYQISFTNGRRSQQHRTLEDALASLREEYPDMVTCDNDPARLLVWENEEDAGPEGDGDDGARAVASIRVVE